jgi:hypothetical protein
MSYFDTYLCIAHSWAVFCLGHEVGKRPEATFSRLAFVAAVNLVFCPLCICLAFYDRSKTNS